MRALRKISRLGLALALLSLSLGLGLAYHRYTSATLDANVTVLKEARPLKPFTLGTLSEATFKNHWTFLVFGFSHCHAVCPNTLKELATVLNDLKIADPTLQVVFVSVDPQHETEKELRAYAASFHSAFKGFRGSPQQTAYLKRFFGVFAEVEPSDNTNVVNHSTSLYLINPEGQWLAVFPYGLRAATIEKNLQYLQANTPHA